MTAPLKVYFLGSGEIGVPVLQTLAQAPEVVLVGVGSQPDRPGKRGGRLVPTPVTAAAAELGITADRPDSVNDPDYLGRLRALDPDVILVIAYGQLLKADVLALPRFGCINVHASLLPKYRGASPIQSAILAREKETGVCFMEMETGLDSGPVYACLRLPLAGTERADLLEAALGRLAAGSAVKVLRGIASGELVRTPQDHARATVCRKIRKEQGVMDFRRPAADLDAMIRAFWPWPGANFLLELPDREMRITVCEAEIVPGSGAPGEILSRDKHGWIIMCGDAALSLKIVSVPGKKTMPATGFLNGLRGAPMRVKTEETI